MRNSVRVSRYHRGKMRYNNHWTGLNILSRDVASKWTSADTVETYRPTHRADSGWRQHSQCARSTLSCWRDAQHELLEQCVIAHNRLAPHPVLHSSRHSLYVRRRFDDPQILMHIFVSFLPRDATHERGLCRRTVTRCLHMRPASVTFVDSVETEHCLTEQEAQLLLGQPTVR